MTNESRSKKKADADDREMIQDQFVYLIWSNLVFAKLFFARFLPPQLLRVIDLASLEPGPNRMTSRKGSDSFADIFYKFRFKSGKQGLLVVLIEHKSCYDRFVSLQILRYEAGVFAQMEQEPQKFVDENGLLPVPYSILLCQKPCPQFDEIVSRCDGLDYGVRTRFQEICFNRIDVDALLDEPLLHVALGLARFAGYKDEEKESRQSELLTLFRSLTNLDPMRRENLKETWKFIFDVSLNYLSRITRNTSFNMNQFKRELFNMEGDGMQSQIYDDVFEEFFSDKVQPYKNAVAIAEAQTQKAEAKTQEAEAKTQEAEAKTQEAEAKTQEALSRVKIVDELFISTMYDAIGDALCESGKVEKLPGDVLNKIKQIESYSFLRKLLKVANSRKCDYSMFLATLDGGEKEEANG